MMSYPRLLADDLVGRRSRLHDLADGMPPPRMHAGDHITDPSLASFLDGMVLRDAAVLIPVQRRPDGASLILTRRTDHLKSHAGQIAFPGGKIDGTDAGPVAAALREAEEEIGLDPAAVEPLGMLSPYISNTGYRIFPVVGLVDPAAAMSPNPEEVAEIFDVPFGFLMDPASHVIETRAFRGIDRRFYAMTWENRRIWGVTAGILRLFYEEVFA